MSPLTARPQKPETLDISYAEWEALLFDPVMAAKVIFNVDLDAFQACRLRYYWWVQNVIDSSGVGSGKTIVIWLFLMLRAILIPNQHVGIYYPTFGTGKNEFWNYFRDFAAPGRAPIYLSQLGDPLKLEPGELPDGDGTVHGPDCYKAFFRNGNRVLMPAPSFMKDAVTQASLSLNVMVVEEAPQVDAMSDGINKQLIDRTRRESWNQYHPLWGNHILFSGHAKTKMDPFYTRYKAHQRKVDAGDPEYANISYSYKDYSNLISHTGKSWRDERRIESTINNKRNTCSKIEWLGQGFGIWSANGDAWFSEAAILQCVENGRRRGLVPVLSRAQWEEYMDGIHREEQRMDGVQN